MAGEAGGRCCEVCDRLVHSSLADKEGAGGVTGVHFISPQAPGGLGLCARGHQVVLLFGGSFFRSAKQLRKFASHTII